MFVQTAFYYAMRIFTTTNRRSRSHKTFSRFFLVIVNPTKVARRMGEEGGSTNASSILAGKKGIFLGCTSPQRASSQIVDAT